MAGSVWDRGLVSTVDLTPTILDLARTRPCVTRKRCRTLDGRSLAGPAGGNPNGFADRALTRCGLSPRARVGQLSRGQRSPKRVLHGAQMPQDAQVERPRARASRIQKRLSYPR